MERLKQMFSGTIKYLVDANAIKNLSVEDLKARSDSNHIIVTIPEVRREVPSLKQRLSLIRDETLTNEAYDKMKEILVYPVVRKLVDYYENKGAADVALLAHALTFQGVGMFTDRVVIVTEDQALREACQELRIESLPVDDFNRHL